MTREAIREATVEDADDIVRLIRALAVYEREPDAVANTPELVERWLFGEDAVASALVAEVDGHVVGVAVWYRSYSTWTGCRASTSRTCSWTRSTAAAASAEACWRHSPGSLLDRGYARFEWVVLDWNTPAIEFYESLGARPMQEWTTYRVDGERLAVLAAGRPV